jgi:PAS domain S-box-containing protein
MRMFGVLQDITELKLAEQAARESENKYRALMEQASDGIVVCDIAGDLLAVNSMACELLGYDREELLQLHLNDLILPREGDEKPIRADRLAAGVDLLVERRLRRKDGSTFTVEASATMLEDGRVQIIARDVSDRKAAEEERRRLEEKMRQAQKLESLGVLAGGIAHDFNNLLVGVLGNAGLALMEVDDDSPAREYIESIETAAIRAADLCRQMLAYSGKGAFVIQPLDLSLLAQEMLGLMKVSISKKVLLDGVFSRGLPLIQADATQVRQIVMNLVTNAGEAMGEKGGVLSIRTGLRRIDDEYRAACYMHEAPLSDECVFLSVADSGVGMDEATRSRIFDPFFTTKFTGRGLGLAAVLGIVRGHRGGIRVESEPGRGTTFTVLFPARPQGSISSGNDEGAELRRPVEESRFSKTFNNGRGRHSVADAHHL